MEIKSYRAVFDLERRIYRVDSLRLNPSGVPLRGLAYFAALLAAMLALGGLPLLGSLVKVAPWYVRGLLAPALCAAALTMIRLDGRASHLAAWALVRRGGGSWACWNPAGRRRPMRPGARWRPGALILIADGSDGRLRRLRYTGPGTARVGVAHALRQASPRPRRCRPGGAAVTVGSPRGPRGRARRRTIALERGVRLEVRP